MSTEFKEVFTTFENLTDPRRSRTRLHDLFEMVVVAVCATIAGSNSFTDIERFGHERLEWLRTFLHLENGIPSHDTFGRVYEYFLSEFAIGDAIDAEGTFAQTDYVPHRTTCIDTTFLLLDFRRLADPEQLIPAPAEFAKDALRRMRLH